jgi:O-antigen ligase
MKEIFYIKDSIENKISFYHLVLFLCALPFDRFYSTLVLISYLIHTVIYLRPVSLRMPDASVFIFQSVFYVTIFSSIYTISFTDAMKVAGRQLGIFIFPLLFFYSPLNLAKYRRLLLMVVCFSCACTVLYLYFDALRVIRYNNLSFQVLFSWEFVNQNFTLPIHMHATYFSMLIILGMMFCVDQVVNQKQKVLFCTLFIVLTAGLFQLSAKSAIVSYFVIMLTGVPWMLMRRKIRKVYFFGFIIVLAAVVSFLLSFEVFKERYINGLRNDLVENRVVSDASSRISRWHVSFDLIRKAPLLGTGSGSENDLLRQSYFNRKMYASYLASLNAHNQYLSFLINSGLLGLLIYLVTLGWGLQQSIKFNDIYLFSFIVMVAVVSISEDMLDLNKGVFIYSFFFSFLFYSMKKPSEQHIEMLATSPS